MPIGSLCINQSYVGIRRSNIKAGLVKWPAEKTGDCNCRLVAVTIALLDLAGAVQ